MVSTSGAAGKPPLNVRADQGAEPPSSANERKTALAAAKAEKAEKEKEDRIADGPNTSLARESGAHTRPPPTGLQQPRGSGDPFEMRERQPDILMRAPRAKGPEVTSALADAAKLQQAGKTEEAVKRLLSVVNDNKLDRTDRAVAAIEIGRITLGADSPDRTRAEVFYLKAVGLDPNVPGGKHLYLDLLYHQQRTVDALKVVDELLKDTPQEVPLLRRKAALLLRNAKDADGLRVANQALTEAKAQGITGRELERVKLTLAHALYRNKKPADAIKIYKEILADKTASDSAMYSAHAGIAELVLPKHGGTPTGEAKKKFDAANDAYKKGDYAQVKKLALDILKLDPNDGLAHRMFCTAVDREDDAAAKTPLIEPLNTEAKREAVLQRFTDIVKTAKVGTSKRDGEPSDLFPQWNILNTEQKATVAYSVLGYGKLIPKLIENGAKYNIVGVGTSAAAVDPHTAPTEKNSWGRHYYAVRGWQYDDFIVTGVEDIDAAARGGYNTITHEFAHLVHQQLERGSAEARAEKARARAEGRTPNIPKETAELAGAFDNIERLYREASDEKNGQQLLDAYSGNTVYEYFAQGVMAYLNPHGGGEENARRLYSRNPKLWKFTKAFTETYRDFPKAVPAVDHPEVGQDAVGAPLTLGRLIKENKPETLAGARAVLEHLEALFNPGGVAKAHPEAATLSHAERQDRKQLLLQRAGELAEIQAGKRPPNFLGDPEPMIAVMGGAELVAQTSAEVRRLDAAIAKTTKDSERKQLEALRAELKKVQTTLAKNLDLKTARQRLTELHQRLEAVLRP